MNKTLRLVLALVLALVMVFALTACAQHDCEKDGHEFVEGVCKHCGEEEKTGGDLPEGLPIEDGKVTFWLTLTDIELKDWNSIWLCGPMNYTAESSDFAATAAEMQRLGETNVYYAQVPVAGVEAGLVAAANPGEYQLTLGWNANSGASAEKQGAFANNQGFVKRYPSISFEGAFCINYFFTPSYAPDNGITLYYWNATDYESADLLTASNATGTMKLEDIGNGQYRGDITGIAAKALSEAVYVAAAYKSNGTVWTSGVLGYSIGTYCTSQSTKGGTIADLAMATAVYGYHAKQYFG
jgi:hypothetical protein